MLRRSGSNGLAISDPSENLSSNLYRYSATEVSKKQQNEVRWVVTEAGMRLCIPMESDCGGEGWMLDAETGSFFPGPARNFPDF